MNNKSIVSIAIVAFVTSGCASIISGTTQRVTFDSDPQGATVFVGKKGEEDGKTTMVESYNAGVTPLEIELPRRSSTMIEISMEGYEKQEVILNREMNPWVWGDIALGSPLSTSIDTSTGAVNEYKPGQYMVNLQAEN